MQKCFSPWDAEKTKKIRRTRHDASSSSSNGRRWICGWPREKEILMIPTCYNNAWKNLWISKSDRSVRISSTEEGQLANQAWALKSWSFGTALTDPEEEGAEEGKKCILILLKLGSGDHSTWRNSLSQLSPQFSSAQFTVFRKQEAHMLLRFFIKALIYHHFHHLTIHTHQ